MVIDWNVSFEYTVIHNAENRQDTAHILLSIFQKHLNSFKFFLTDNCAMVIFIEILISVLIILFMLVIK